MVDLGLHEKLAIYKSARDRATQWLLSLQHTDGSIGPVEEGAYYYRLPWTLTVVGETESAHRFVQWLRTHMLTSSGELHGKLPLGGWAGDYTYLIGNLVCGAQIMGEFDIAQAGIKVL